MPNTDTLDKPGIAFNAFFGVLGAIVLAFCLYMAYTAASRTPVMKPVPAKTK